MADSDFNRKHPRDEDGKFTNKHGGSAAGSRERLENIYDSDKRGVLEKEKNQNTYADKKKQIQCFIAALKGVTKLKIKELVDIIKSFQPVELHTDNKELIAEFDKYTAQKNIYTRGNSSPGGFLFKLEHINDLPKMVLDTHYDYSKEEKGKESRQHQGVKEWHYFKGKIATEMGNFYITVNVRDKGDRQFVYEISLKDKK